MCGSEELIHDARQVDLEEMIMTNETPLYLVPGRLTDEQDTVIRRNMIGGPILDPADMFAFLVRTIGTPIQPCADVETVAILKGSTAGYSSVTGPLGHMPIPEYQLVRRTDMEAQVARVAAEKDAEIARLKDMLSLFVEYEKLMDDGEDVAAMSVYADFTKEVTAALNEGSAG